MRKIKLNERQILMLQKLNQDKSDKTKVLRITESQYNRLFKDKGNAVKKLGKSIEKSGMVGENTKKIDLVDFAQEIVVFIKDVLSKSDPRTIPHSPYWSEMGISKNQLFKLIKKHNLLALVDESEIREYMAPKVGFRKNVKELYKTITEWGGDAGYPAGASDDPRAPWNQEDPDFEAQEEIITIPEEKRKFKILYKSPEDGMSIFKAGNELFVACLCDISGINEDPVEWDDKIYMYDYEGTPDAITAQGFEDYINDMYSQGEIKPIRNDKTNKFPVPTLLTPKVKQTILKYYGDQPKMVQIINQIPETTGATSSGAYVAGGSIGGPISDKMSKSPAEELANIVISDGIDPEGVVSFKKEKTGEEPFEIDGIKWQYVWADYGGKTDVGVYRYGQDITYSLPWFQKNVLKNTMTEDFNDYNPVSHLSELINSAIESVDPNLNYDVFAKAVAKTLADQYGRHLFDKFLGVVVNSLSDKMMGEQDIEETTSTVTVGAGVGTNGQGTQTNPQYAYDAPAGDGKDFWTAGNKLNKKMGKNGTPIVRGGSMNEELTPNQEYLQALDSFKIARFKLQKNDPKFIALKKDLINKASVLGIKLQLPENKTLKISENQLKKIIESENMSKTAYPNGEMVDFDDCTKLNNNTKAQDGGCSTGAVDGVVKTKKTKGSVVSK